MQKLIAIVNVIAWAGFWAFGYLAISARAGNAGQMVTAAILAALGGAVGLLAYLRLARDAERSGYARPANRARMRDEDNPKEVV